MHSQTLRPISEQVVVITGASSGVGRETSLQFAQRGATVVPLARNGEALETLKHEIERIGGVAHVVEADVSEWPQVRGAADEIAERFGRIDTWINNAAVGLYATVEDATVEEIRRVIDVVLMGQIHGMKAALPHMRRHDRGAIINVASALAKRSVPLQAAYCAAKHGIKGFSESLRLELQRAGSGISVTVILPSSINTPLFGHARSKVGQMPQPLPPVYEPRAVAESIRFAAVHPRRQITVGGAGKALEVLERLSPRLADLYLRQGDRAFEQQKSGRTRTAGDNLFEPTTGRGRTAGEFGQNSKAVSLYTRLLEQHPNRKRWVTAAAVAGVLLLTRSVRSSSSRRARRSRT